MTFSTFKSFHNSGDRIRTYMEWLMRPPLGTVPVYSAVYIQIDNYSKLPLENTIVLVDTEVKEERLSMDTKNIHVDFEKLSASLVDVLPIAIIIFNSKHDIIYCNKHTEAVFGYKTEELIGKPLSSLVPDRFKESHSHDAHEYMKNPKPRSMNNGLELYAIHADHHEFPVEIALSPLVKDDGEQLVVASILDLTKMTSLILRVDSSVLANTELQGKIVAMKEKMVEMEEKYSSLLKSSRLDSNQRVV